MKLTATAQVSVDGVMQVHGSGVLGSRFVTFDEERIMTHDEAINDLTFRIKNTSPSAVVRVQRRSAGA